VESLARAVLVALSFFLALGVVGLVTALRASYHGKIVAWIALAFSGLQVIAGFTVLAGIRPVVLIVLLSPGLAGVVLALRRLSQLY
jgi:hypothetical protein